MKPTLDRDDIRRRSLAMIDANAWKPKTAGDMLGVSETTIARMTANGDRWANMSRATVERIADHLARLEAAAAPRGIVMPPLDEPTVIDPTTPAPEPTLPVARHTGMLPERMHNGQPVYTIADVADALQVSRQAAWAIIARRTDEFIPGRDTVNASLTGRDEILLTRRGALRVAMHSHGPNALALQNHLLDLDEAMVAGQLQPAPTAVDPLARLSDYVISIDQTRARQIQAVRQVADDAMTIAQAAPAAALGLLKQERDEAAKLRRVLEKRVATIVEEALSRGFYGGNRRKAFQDVNGDIADRFGTRDGMSSDALRLAITYVDERHTKLTAPNRLDLGASA